MRLIFLICFLALFFGANGQPVVNRASQANTVQDARLSALYNFFLPKYADTAAANLNIGIDSLGAKIFTYDIYGEWTRTKNQNGTKYWSLTSGGGNAPGGGGNWIVSGTGQTVLNSLTGAGIGTANAYPMWFITNGQIRIQLPASGLTLSNDTTSNKVFTFNPSTKDWGYANWVGGGGSGGSGWGLTGNAFTDPLVNFLGTTDATDLVFRTNNLPVATFGGSDYNFGFGFENIWTGPYSMAIGRQDTSTGLTSFAVGFRSKASGDQSIALGNGSRATATASVSVGSGNLASGEGSFASGINNIASGSISTATGGNDTASGNYSFVSGFESKASGTYSFAQGHESIASGVVSIAMGNGAVSTGYGATTFGKGFTNAKDTSFAVGFTTRKLEVSPDSVIISPTLATLISSPLKYTSGTPGSGKVLVSDASGNATWSSTISATSVPLSGITTSLANNIVDGGGFRFGISNNDGIHLTSATTADTLFTISRTGSNPIVRVDSSGNTYFTGAIFGSANSSSFDASGNMRITGSGKYASFQTGAFIEGYQNKLVFKRSYPLTNDSIGFKITNDTLNASGASGTVYYPFVVASKNFSTDAETERFKVRQDGRVTINDGTAVNGYVLTTDANGNASWQAASGGITSLNGLTGATQTFAVSGQGLTISSSGTTHTFTSSDFTTASKSSDQSSTAIALENCTDLSFSADANATYEFEGKVIFTADASTTGIAFNMNGPSASFANTTFEVAVSGTGITFGNSSAFSPTAYYNTTSGNGTTPSLMIIKGLARTTASGTIQFKFMPEAGSGGTVTVKQYSILKWRKIP